VQIAAAAEVYAHQEGIVNVYSDETPGREFVDQARADLSAEDVAHATEAGGRLTINEALDLARIPKRPQGRPTGGSRRERLSLEAAVKNKGFGVARQCHTQLRRWWKRGTAPVVGNRVAAAGGEDELGCEARSNRDGTRPGRPGQGPHRGAGHESRHGSARGVPESHAGINAGALSGVVVAAGGVAPNGVAARRGARATRTGVFALSGSRHAECCGVHQ
jgi:hypothetical protein